MNELDSVVDLDRYPIHDLHSPKTVSVLNQCHIDLAQEGVCSLPAFLLPGAIHATVEVGDRLAERAWHADQTHNVYFTDPDLTVEAGHPSRHTVRSSQWALAYDLLPSNLPIRTLYESEAMLNFVSAVLGADQLFRSVDPLDGVNISLFHHDDELGWHFDNSEFSVTLMLRPPVAGGDFEFYPSIREDGNANYDAVRDVLAGTSPRATTLATAPGTLAIFKGRHALHRVTPVSGSPARMNSVLTYGTDPGMHLSELTQKLFYGRRVLPA